MEKPFAKLTFPTILAVAMLLTSCSTSDAAKSTESSAAIYETAKEIKAMPPCKATVVHTYPCYSLLRATDGKKFCIGSPGATPEVGNFVETLKDGKTYKFPDAFLAYQKRLPR